MDEKEEWIDVPNDTEEWIDNPNEEITHEVDGETTDSENEEDDEETTFNAITTLTPEEDLLESRIIINTSNTTIHKKLTKDGPIIDIAPGMYI